MRDTVRTGVVVNVSPLRGTEWLKNVSPPSQTFAKGSIAVSHDIVDDTADDVTTSKVTVYTSRISSVITTSPRRLETLQAPLVCPDRRTPASLGRSTLMYGSRVTMPAQADGSRCSLLSPPREWNAMPRNGVLMTVASPVCRVPQRLSRLCTETHSSCIRRSQAASLPCSPARRGLKSQMEGATRACHQATHPSLVTRHPLQGLFRTLPGSYTSGKRRIVPTDNARITCSIVMHRAIGYCCAAQHSTGTVRYSTVIHKTAAYPLGSKLRYAWHAHHHPGIFLPCTAVSSNPSNSRSPS